VVVGGAALTQPGGSVVSEVRLAAAADSSATGVAKLTEDGDRYSLALELNDASVAAGEYNELWLIKADGTGLISLGPALDGNTYEIPENIEVSEYPIVDVSDEPIDGDPAHSGDTICRGKLSI
jgi:hypothetical protein